MKEKLPKILNILSFAMLVVCLVKITWMENDIQNLRNTVNNNHSILQNRVANISNDVRYEMEQANNLLSDSGWDIGNLNVEDKTATINCYVVPKEYNPQKTAAILICNEKEFPMILENGRYTAEIIIPVFEQSVINNVQFSEEGTIRTQQLNWGINPRYDMVPAAYINYSGERRQNYKGESITRSYSGWIEIDFEHKGFTKINNDAEVVYLINGKEEWRYSPILEEQYSDEYISHCIAEIKQSFEIKRGDTIEMYVQFTDSNGWKYLCVLEDTTIGEKGNPIHNREHYQSEADIYDADGNLIFQPYKY